ncbi:30S ribosomal protein S14 type Z [Candidatus Gugararchaeum adminiculabundum]|nr:30S ribosomal protein S14 type Z [Candidatus Gugararchaeum adminiculabundum]
MEQKEKKKLNPIERELMHKFKGKNARKCRFCGTARGLIRKYKLQICRRCFREVGEKIGFRKY